MGHFSIIPFLALLMALGISSAQAQSNSDETYRVYNAVIADMFAGDSVTFDTRAKVKQLILRDQTTSEYAGHGSKENWDSVKERFRGKLAEDTIADYDAKLKSPTALKRSFDLDLKYSFLSKKESDAIFDSGGNFDHTRDNWTKFYEKYPDSGGFIMLSNVGFSKTGDQALVYVVHWCGDLCGTGHYVLLSKDEDKWKVDEKAMIWIS